MQCPQCNSENVLRTEIAYAQGSTSGSMSGKTVTRVRPLHSVRSYSTGQFESRTAFAQAIAPPKRRLPCLPVIIVFMALGAIGFPLLVSAYDYRLTQGDTAAMTLFFLGFTGGSFLGWLISWPAQQRANQEYHTAHNLWMRSWVCAQCGYAWIPDPRAPA